jgi:hypothetical protein
MEICTDLTRTERKQGSLTGKLDRAVVHCIHIRHSVCDAPDSYIPVSPDGDSVRGF